METLWQDLRYGARQLLRNPGFTGIAVLTLALGIGATTAMFSIVNAILLRPLPFAEPERLVALWQTEAAPGNYPITGEDYLDWKAQNKTLEAIGLYDWPKSYNLSVSGAVEPASGVPTEANFFSVLGVSPLLGRTFAEGEDFEGRNHVAVLSYGLWKNRFGGGSDVIGKSIVLNGEAFTIVGVMPQWFRFPSAVDLWIPIDMSPQKLTKRGTHNYRAIARLKQGVSIQQAQADLSTIAARLEEQYPETNAKVGAVVVPLEEELVAGYRQQSLMLLGAVALMLLIACANVANLLLARTTGRAREIAVRTALGATRGQILRQMLTENMLIVMAAGAIGLAGAGWLLDSLSSVGGLHLPSAIPIQLDGRVVAFTITVAGIVGILLGFAASLHSSEFNLGEVLKASAASLVSTRGLRQTLGNWLVIGQIAASVALLLGAGLLLRSFVNLRSTDIGIQSKNILTARIVLPETRYSTFTRRKQFYDQLLERLQHTAGIQAASISARLPLEGGFNGYISIQGDMNPAMANQLVEWNFVTPEYFDVFGIPLLQGRGFTNEDLHRSAEVYERVVALLSAGKEKLPMDLVVPVIVNERMARDFWPQQDPVGKIFKIASIAAEVVGVVGNVKQHGLREAPLPEVYVPLTLQLEAADSLVLAVKARGSPSGLLGAVRGELQRLDSQLALFHARTMEEIISEHMQDTTHQTISLGIFAGIALTLAAIGIYGLMAYWVTSRTREIGIRIALGAAPPAVLRLVLGRGAKLTLTGIALGLLGSVALARLIRSFLFGVGPDDLATIVGVVVLLGAIALVACYVPARRAARVNPVVALRYE